MNYAKTKTIAVLLIARKVYVITPRGKLIGEGYTEDHGSELFQASNDPVRVKMVTKQNRENFVHALK
ncbi:hypothetical protein [Halobacillus naozhouensis]|uniref:Uncharacterized protein n=1 Tax=Halobacillus naozhouensis TaxID=554880 RepID=A0ABY8IVP3_9BACI|nr:hypothetical protein [Halobacillus naozhouensis]WFT73283.1 hypothetical protein P9989_12845 [Halobacillus naozhouensis]